MMYRNRWWWYALYGIGSGPDILPAIVRIGAAMVDPVRAGHTWDHLAEARRGEACFWLNNATQRNGPTVWTATETATAGRGGGGR
jgi:hypothetical protein